MEKWKLAPRSTLMLPITKIVSGGQTGADRAALDFAIECEILHGGWCPKGRRAEDGEIDARYQLQESPSTNYLQRTEWNVRDTDGTVIFTMNPHLSGGSKKTAEFAKKHHKPWLHLFHTEPLNTVVESLQQFIQEHDIKILNVAGTRGSKEPDVGAFVRAVLDGVIGKE